MAQSIPAKDFLARVAEQFADDEKFRRPQTHFAGFTNSLKADLPAKWFTTAIAADVAAEVRLMGRLPSFPELKELLKRVGARRDEQQVAAGPKRVEQPTCDRMTQAGLDWLNRAVVEGYDDAAKANVVSCIRSYYPDAYKLIAKDHDPVRWHDERRRTAEALEKQERDAQRDAIALQVMREESRVRAALQAPPVERYFRSRPAPALPEPERPARAPNAALVAANRAKLGIRPVQVLEHEP